MKSIILTAGAVGVLATSAIAQTTAQTTGTYDAAAGTSHNPAIKDSTPAHTTMAAKGSNSFTEDQARSRLIDAGYTNVTGLAKDKQGVWRASAVKGGATVQVGLDYKGNVTTGSATTH